MAVPEIMKNGSGLAYTVIAEFDATTPKVFIAGIMFTTSFYKPKILTKFTKNAERTFSLHV